VESLPQLLPSSASAHDGGVETIAAYSALAEFFEQECFMPGGDNFCPAGTDVSGGDTNPRKFTPMTLLGLVYHAEMYSGGLQTACAHQATTLTPSSFVAHVAEGSQPTRFILDDFSWLTCLQPTVFGEKGASRVFSTDPRGSYQATLTTRYRVPYNGVADPGQTDVFQVYVSYVEGAPAFLAFNFAGANTMFSRAVLLVNLIDHRFAVKYLSQGAPPWALVSIGVGGVDRATGVPHPGSYWARFTDEQSATVERCIDNGTGAFDADLEPCQAGGVPVRWDDAQAVLGYLGVSPDDARRVESWIELLDDASLLGTEDAPSNAAAGGDPERFFPESIR
jgi:hypothetical protein